MMEMKRYLERDANLLDKTYRRFQLRLVVDFRVARLMIARTGLRTKSGMKRFPRAFLPRFLLNL